MKNPLSIFFYLFLLTTIILVLKKWLSKRKEEGKEGRKRRRKEEDAEGTCFANYIIGKFKHFSLTILIISEMIWTSLKKKEYRSKLISRLKKTLSLAKYQRKDILDMSIRHIYNSDEFWEEFRNGAYELIRISGLEIQINITNNQKNETQ